jgi:hypothetical protein
VPDVRIAVLQQGIELKASCHPKFLLQTYVRNSFLIPPLYFTAILCQKPDMVKIKVAASRASLSVRARASTHARMHTHTQFS